MFKKIRITKKTLILHSVILFRRRFRKGDRLPEFVISAEAGIQHLTCRLLDPRPRLHGGRLFAGILPSKGYIIKFKPCPCEDISLCRWDGSMQAGRFLRITESCPCVGGGGGRHGGNAYALTAYPQAGGDGGRSEYFP